jgi:hypothetical protein
MAMFSELDKYSPLGQMRDLLDGITFLPRTGDDAGFTRTPAYYAL